MAANPVIKSAGRVLEIFEFFQNRRTPLSVRQIAQHFGYPVSSTAALMKSLEALGYVSYEPHIHAFLPTLRVAKIGSWVYEALAHREGLIELLSNLAAKTGQTATLSVENDIYAQAVHMVPGEYHIQLQVPPGTRRLLCRSGLGWAILSTYEDGRIRDVVGRTRALLGKGAASITLDQTLIHVAQSRRQGYAYGRALTFRDAGTVAVPLPLSEDGLQMAIGVSGLLKWMDQNMETLAHAMRVEIQAFSRSHAQYAQA